MMHRLGSAAIPRAANKPAMRGGFATTARRSLLRFPGVDFSGTGGANDYSPRDDQTKGGGCFSEPSVAQVCRVTPITEANKPRY
jgi:hypothetical protein